MAHHDECDNNVFRLEYLPVHVLRLIFKYLDIRSLLSLSSTNRALYAIIKNDYINNASYSLLVTNQCSPEIRQKSLHILSGIHKFRNNSYWERKRYKEYVFLRSEENFRPWLQLSKRDLYVSRGSKIWLFKRNGKGIVEKPCIVFEDHADDVLRFKVKGDVMISGGNDGKICYWNTNREKPVFSIKNKIGWNENLYIDFIGKTVAAGFSLMGEVDFWSVQENGFKFCSRMILGERLRSLSLSQDAAFCALGSCGYTTFPLQILDLNREVYFNLHGDFKVGAGIFVIVWETSHTILTGGFDSMLHMWDLRIGRPVLSWSDPFDAAVYSLATDYNCTIMTGAALHSRVTLWDKRKSNWVQVYYVSKTKYAGPVYSLDFDPTYLFVGLDKSLQILDFSGIGNKSKSSMTKYSWRARRLFHA